MEWMIMLLAVLLVIGWIAVRSTGWRTVAAASGGNAEELEAKYAYLKENSVKCKLKSEVAPGMGIVQPGVGGSNQTAKLNVRKKDVEKAQQLLQEFDQQANVL